MRPEPRTFTEKLYRALRADILAGRLVPGQRLKIGEVCQQYGVSLNVVREALNRLTGEDLVTASPQLGFAVTSLTLEDLEDLSFVRLQIEGVALRRAIERAGIPWEAQLVAAHHTLASTPVTAHAPTDDPSEEWMEAHSVFHRALLDGSDSPRLRTITEGLSNSAERYRRWSLTAGAGDRDLPEEHRRIMQAALDRDAELAVTLLSEHIGTTTRVVREAIFRRHAGPGGSEEPAPSKIGPARPPRRTPLPGDAAVG